LTIESLTSSWLPKTCTSEAPGGPTKNEALLSSRGPILASVSPLDPKSSREASSRFRMPARPLHTQCVSRYLSILRCATRSERRDRVQRFTNDSHRQPDPRYSRFRQPSSQTFHSPTLPKDFQLRLRPRRGRFGTLSEQLECGIVGRTAVGPFFGKATSTHYPISCGRFLAVGAILSPQQRFFYPS